MLINPDNKKNKSAFREYLNQKGLTISDSQLEREALGLRRDSTSFQIDFSVGEVVINEKKIFTLIIRDITERKKAEEKLKQYASLCINNPAPVFQMFSDSGEVVGDPNPAFKKVFKFLDKKKSVYEQMPAFKDIVNKTEENDTTQLECSIETKTYLFTISKWHSNLIDVYGDDITEHKKKDEEIHRKSELIQLMQKITITANETSTIDESMQSCLDSICSYTGWPVGHIYFLESGEKLIPSKLWHLDSPEQFKTLRKITEKTSFEKSVGLPGRVLASGKPV